MSSKLDQALDDAIKDRRRTQRSNASQQKRRPSSSTLTSRNERRNTFGGIRKRISGGGGGGGRSSSDINSRLGGGRGREQNSGGGPQRHNRRGKDFGALKRNTDQRWSHDLFSGNGGDIPVEARLSGGRQQRRGNKPDSSSRSGTTLTVENLHYNVTEEDLASVFKLVGTVDKCTIEFDRSGRSTGTAKVIFPHLDVAQKAVDRFNNVDLDGQPMKISLLKKSSGAGSGSGSGGSTRQSRPSRNEADLDAELDAYSKSKDQDGDFMMTD